MIIAMILCILYFYKITKLCIIPLTLFRMKSLMSLPKKARLKMTDISKTRVCRFLQLISLIYFLKCYIAKSEIAILVKVYVIVNIINFSFFSFPLWYSGNKAKNSFCYYCPSPNVLLRSVCLEMAINTGNLFIVALKS